MKLKSMIMSLLMLCVGFTVYSQSSNENTIPIDESVEVISTDMDVMTHNLNYCFVASQSNNMISTEADLSGNPELNFSTGVSTLDLVALQRKIQELEKVDSPYAMLLKPPLIHTTEMTIDKSDKKEFHRILKPPVL